MANTVDWADVTGYEGIYQVSSSGLVRSIDRTIAGKNGSLRSVKGKVLSQAIGTKGRGYKQVSLWVNNFGKTHEVHRLVAVAFCHNKHCLEEVNHIDGNPRNNDRSNLEWCTHKENMKHAIKNNLIDRKKKFSDTDIKHMRILRLSGASYCKIAKLFSASREHVRCVCLGIVRK